MPAPSSNNGPEKPPSLLQTVASVAAAFFGVQSDKNRARDFKQGRAGIFIAVGLAMTAAFILAVWLAVKITLRNAGVN